MRTWLYQMLVNDDGPGGILELLELTSEEVPIDRLHGPMSLTTNTFARPALVYLIGNATDISLDEADTHIDRQFWSIYVHDELGDFGRIDQICARLKKLYPRARGLTETPGEEVQTTEYLETSRDFDDETLKTNFRYVRFQSIVQRGS